MEKSENMHEIEQKIQNINAFLGRYSLVGLEDPKKAIDLVEIAMERLKDLKEDLVDMQCEFKVNLTTHDTNAVFTTNTHLQVIEIKKGRETIFRKSSGGDDYVELEKEEIEKIDRLLTAEKVVMNEEGYSESYGDLKESSVVKKIDAMMKIREFSARGYVVPHFQGVKD